MRFKPTPYVEWESIFAFFPHWCTDTEQMVWLERIYRRAVPDYISVFYEYRVARP